MPEYKRWIAYFYEYINGKRQRNAGFLKAELRDGLWRLQLQLRAGRWPGEGVEIRGYADEGTQCPTVLLGRAYGQKENLMKRMELGTGALNPAGLRFDTLSGVWIPCDAGRCYISHWLEGEMNPERLVLPGEIKLSDMREGDPSGETGTEAGQNGAGTARLYGEEIREEGETEREPEQELESGQKTDKELERDPEQEPEPGQKTDKELEREPEQKPEPWRKTDEEPEREPEPGRKTDKEPEREPEPGRKTDKEPERGSESWRKTEKEPEKKRRQALDSWQTDWSILQKSRQAAASREGVSWIRICPRDILWLKQRGWPVGRNSFLMQGFGQFRYLLLLRTKEGEVLLGVPGLETPQNRFQAAAFGFPEFLKGTSIEGMPENFGYWCRRLEL